MTSVMVTTVSYLLINTADGSFSAFLEVGTVWSFPSFLGLFFALHSFALRAIDLITYTPTHTGKLRKKLIEGSNVDSFLCVLCVA